MPHPQHTSYTRNGTEEENNPASPTEDPAKYTEGGQELILNPGVTTALKVFVAC